MKIEISYSRAALGFIHKNQNRLTRDKSDGLILKAVRKIYKVSIESVDVKALKGKEGVFRIRKGDIRIVFALDEDGNIVVVSVNVIDYRGNVYEK